MNHRVAILTATRSHKDNILYDFWAKTLCEACWRVEIINPVFEGSDKTRIRFRRVALPDMGLFNIRNIWRIMLEALMESRADICIMHDPQLLPMLPMIKRQTPIQVIFDSCDIFNARNDSAPKIREYMLPFSSLIRRRYLPMADALITRSADETAFFEGLCTNTAEVKSEKSLSEICLRLEKQGRYNV